MIRTPRDQIEKNTGERRGILRVLVGKPEGKKTLGRHRRKWEDNIKMDLKEVGWWGYGLDRAGSG